MSMRVMSYPTDEPQYDMLHPTLAKTKAQLRQHAMSPAMSPAMHRRQFLTTSAGAFAGLGLGVRTLSAAHVGRHAGDALLGDPLAPDQLRQIAAYALEAAKGAGAQYADARVAHVQSLSVFLDPTSVPNISVDSTLTYGVRAMVNGALASDYGTVPEPDAVASTARNAVTQAKGFATLSNDRTEFAPAPAVQGEWQSTVKIDPFTVPILEQGDLLGAYRAAMGGRIEGAGANGGFHWERETRVCANTDGTLTTQTFMRASPGIGSIGHWLGVVFLALPDFGPCMAGYEYVIQPGLQDRIKAHAETCTHYARLHAKPLDIGRYPIVFDGQSTATLLNYTLGPALQMDRVLGLEADTSGGSFLSPHTEILDTPIFSSLVSVSASRPLTDICGAKWDDEGVTPREVSVINNGRVVDYLTDRQTAPALKPWYNKQRQPLRSNGFSVACTADRPVLVGNGYLEMRPITSSASLDDLTKQLKHGVVLIQARSVSTDQQLASGFLSDGLLLEVKDGQITNRIRNAGLQFKTTTLWKQVETVGDSTTLGIGNASLNKGQPWQPLNSTSRAPAMHCAAIDVIQMKSR